jgi:hypothetical protein
LKLRTKTNGLNKINYKCPVNKTFAWRKCKCELLASQIVVLQVIYHVSTTFSSENYKLNIVCIAEIERGAFPAYCFYTGINISTCGNISDGNMFILSN